MQEDLLFAERLNTDNMLFGSEIDQDGEPQHIQTEIFDIADDLSSA